MESFPLSTATPVEFLPDQGVRFPALSKVERLGPLMAYDDLFGLRIFIHSNMALFQNGNVWYGLLGASDELAEKLISVYSADLPQASSDVAIQACPDMIEVVPVLPNVQEAESRLHFDVERLNRMNSYAALRSFVYRFGTYVRGVVSSSHCSLWLKPQLGKITDFLDQTDLPIDRKLLFLGTVSFLLNKTKSRMCFDRACDAISDLIDSKKLQYLSLLRHRCSTSVIGSFCALRKAHFRELVYNTVLTVLSIDSTVKSNSCTFKTLYHGLGLSDDTAKTELLRMALDMNLNLTFTLHLTYFSQLIKLCDQRFLSMTSFLPLTGRTISFPFRFLSDVYAYNVMAYTLRNVVPEISSFLKSTFPIVFAMIKLNLVQGRLVIFDDELFNNLIGALSKDKAVVDYVVAAKSEAKELSLLRVHDSQQVVVWGSEVVAIGSPEDVLSLRIDKTVLAIMRRMYFELGIYLLPRLQASTERVDSLIHSMMHWHYPVNELLILHITMQDKRYQPNRLTYYIGNDKKPAKLLWNRKNIYIFHAPNVLVTNVSVNVIITCDDALISSVVGYYTNVVITRQAVLTKIGKPFNDLLLLKDYFQRGRSLLKFISTIPLTDVLQSNKTDGASIIPRLDDYYVSEVGFELFNQRSLIRDLGERPQPLNEDYDCNDETLLSKSDVYCVMQSHKILLKGSLNSITEVFECPFYCSSRHV